MTTVMSAVPTWVPDKVYNLKKMNQLFSNPGHLQDPNIMKSSNVHRIRARTSLGALRLSLIFGDFGSGHSLIGPGLGSEMGIVVLHNRPVERAR